MALDPVDTTTDHGTYKGDPAPVAFSKVNDNDLYLEELAKASGDLAAAAVPKAGGIITGPLQWSYGGTMLRVINGGDGSAVLQAVNAAGNNYANMGLRASSYIFAGNGMFHAQSNQLRIEGPAIPDGQYQGYILQKLYGKPGNNADFLDTQYYRDTNTGGGTGKSWSDFNWRVGRTVDASNISYLEFKRDQSVAIFTGGGVAQFNFLANGNATASGSWINGGSDPAIKNTATLRPVTNATESLCALNVRIGKYLPEFNADERDRAFVMADDDMRAATPEVIVEEVIAGKYAGWATDQLIAYLVAAHQEGCRREASQASAIQALVDRIAALEQRPVGAGDAG